MIESLKSTSTSRGRCDSPDIVGEFVFKASFDKANRTSLKGFRGLRDLVVKGLRILGDLRKATGLAVLTDIHEPSQAGPAAEAVDILQIPAFLCRQTDLLLEAGRTGKIVNIKKGQFVAPGDILHAAEKVASTGNDKIILTERGSSFGYNNLVVDMRGLKIMAAGRISGGVFRCNAQRAAAQRNGTGGSSGGQPQFIEPLASAAVATGAAGNLRGSARQAGACTVGRGERSTVGFAAGVLETDESDP